MNDFVDDTLERAQFLDTHVKELERVNKDMARLILKKEKLTEQIIGALGHEHAGQKTYEYSTWRIEVKTPFVYALNKRIYESGAIELPTQYNPIKESKAYSIDKKLCDEYMIAAPKKVQRDLAKLIDLKPGKKGIVIKERI